MSVLANTIFYDIESSGLDTAFDQVLQFYGCRLDESGDVVAESHVHVQALVDCVIDPRAVMVHRIVPSFDHGLPEYEAMQQIHSFLNTPGCRNGGYNTLGFDDEFLRFSFYRNFLNPYQHQWAQQCSRMDIFPVVAFFAVMSPEVLVWPERNGRRSLKLEDLNNANGWLQGQAHDASFDVKVTVCCAQELAKNPEKFSYVMGYFQKDIDKARMLKYCDDYKGVKHALMMDTRFSFANQFIKPVVFIGYHEIYRNQTLWLSIDKPLKDLEKDEIRKKIYRKKVGEPGFILPPTDSYCEKLGDRQKIAHENLDWLVARPNILADLRSLLSVSYDAIEGLDPDTGLYQMGFLSQEQTHEQAKIVSMPLEREKILRNAKGSYYERALRFCLRHDPSVWQKISGQSEHNYVQSVLTDKDNALGQKMQTKRALSPMRAMAQDMLQHAHGEDKILLQNLIAHFDVQQKQMKHLLSQ